jgi:hypothetical protein
MRDANKGFLNFDELMLAKVGAGFKPAPTHQDTHVD